MRRGSGATIDVLIDEVDEEGAIGRSAWDAPEIDGSVFLNGDTKLVAGDMVRARIVARRRVRPVGRAYPGELGLRLLSDRATWRRRLFDPPVNDPHVPVGAGRQVQVVGDHHDGAAGFVDELAEDREHLLARMPCRGCRSARRPG